MKVLSRVGRLAENLTLVHAGECKHRHLHLSQRRLEAALIDGVKRANCILEQLTREVAQLQEQGHRTPQLTTILVGDHYPSHVYIKRKISAAKAVGISTNTVYLESSIKESELISIIKSLNDDRTVDAVLVQLPLPDHLCERTVCNYITPGKDVDGFSFTNLGRFILNMDALLPCTALAVQDLIKSTEIETKGKMAVVCGRSKNVGFPIATVLHANGEDGGPGLDATTTICHRFTPHDQLCMLTRSADILVSATGVPGLITGAMVKPGACVIDVGITRFFDKHSKKTQLVGDVKFDEVREVAGFLTPVPGGVGPMTVAMLLKNTLKAARHQAKTP